MGLEQLWAEIARIARIKNMLFGKHAIVVTCEAAIQGSISQELRADNCSVVVEKNSLEKSMTLQMFLHLIIRSLCLSCIIVSIWVFPKIGVPPNHPFISGFPL